VACGPAPGVAWPPTVHDFACQDRAPHGRPTVPDDDQVVAGAGIDVSKASLDCGPIRLSSMGTTFRPSFLALRSRFLMARWQALRPFDSTQGRPRSEQTRPSQYPSPGSRYSVCFLSMEQETEMVDAGRRLSFTHSGQTPEGFRCQDPEPDSGNQTVRDRKGACGNVSWESG